MGKEKVYSIKDTSKILGLTKKALYARLKNEKYKKCFVIVPNLKKNFLFYKAKCVEEELANKITEKEKKEFTDFYFQILFEFSKKMGFSKNDIVNSEKELRKKLREKLKNKDNKKYLINKIITCSPVNKKELDFFKQILKEILDSL